MTTDPGEGPAALNPGNYPRSYSLGGGYRVLGVVLGLVVAVGSLLLIHAVGLQGAGPPAARMTVSVLFLAFLVLGVYLVASPFRYRVTLDTHSIEVSGVLRRRQVDRRDIKGIRRAIVRGGQANWVVVLNDGAGRNLQVTHYLKTDSFFKEWIKSFPDLDREADAEGAREAAEASRILEARGVGPGAQRRLRQLSKVLGPGSYALLFALLVLRKWQPVLAWVAIAWPLATIALVARYQPFLRFGGRKGQALPDLSLGLFIPGLALAMVGLNSLHALDWQTPLTMAIVGGVLLAGLAWWVDPWLRGQRWTAIGVALLCCAYGYGAGFEVDALLDTSVPEYYPVRVVSKYVSHGKSTSYHVAVSPWGPIASQDELTVPYDRYARTRVGDTLCTSLHKGALSIPWYVLGDCPASRLP